MLSRMARLWSGPCVLLFTIVCYLSCLVHEVRSEEAKQVWDYVHVRDDAYMFWWLYYTNAQGGYQNAPLILWLQGGPGASSTGYGNFMEIGPEDMDHNERTTTWLKKGSLLFIDNPVGTGFSYVTSSTAYARNDDDIAKDLLTVMKTFLEKFGDFQTVPFYIFSESYGGKMTAAFSQTLYNAIKNGDITCNFKGLAMGDSWISPLDSVLTWGPYLHSTSLVDKTSLEAINFVADKCVKAAEAGDWTGSTDAWNQLETTVEMHTNGVNFYNILKWGDSDDTSHSKKSHTASIKDNHIHPRIGKLFQKHHKVFHQESLSDFMNGPVRDKLKIIPTNVTWGGQSAAVFQALSGDFMKNVTGIVDSLLLTDLTVVVYTGQLDLIVDTIGTEQWVQKLSWPYLDKYNSATRKAFYTGTVDIKNMAGFVKSYRNFQIYWILNAGHMVPSDAGEAALEMLGMITGT